LSSLSLSISKANEERRMHKEEMRELRQTVTELRATMFDLRDSTNSLLFRASQSNLDPLRYSHFDVIRQSSDNLHVSHPHHFSHFGGLLHDNLEKHTLAAAAGTVGGGGGGGGIVSGGNRSTFRPGATMNNNNINEKDEEFDDQKTTTSKASVNATESSTILNATLDDSVHNDGGLDRLSELKSKKQKDTNQAPEFVGPATSDDEFGEVCLCFCH
jgi:hypothetical protein